MYFISMGGVLSACLPGAQSPEEGEIPMGLGVTAVESCHVNDGKQTRGLLQEQQRTAVPSFYPLYLSYDLHFIDKETDTQRQ